MVNLKFTDKEILNPQEMIFIYHLWNKPGRLKQNTIRIRVPEKIFETLQDYSIESVFFTFTKDYIVECLHNGKEIEEFINEENYTFKIPDKLEEYHQNDILVETIP